MTAARPLMRISSGVEETLCWRFLVHGRAEPTYEPASGQRGPFDPDRMRYLKPGETFQRLDRSGHPCAYQGLFWRPKDTISLLGPSPGPVEDP